LLPERRRERHRTPSIRVEVDAVLIERRDQLARTPMGETMMEMERGIAEVEQPGVHMHGIAGAKVSNEPELELERREPTLALSTEW
jgi:hypothetical protein